MSEFTVVYRHPVIGGDGKYLSSANIIWDERDQGSSYYRTSKFGMKGGRFPIEHPCQPLDGDYCPHDRSQHGDSPALRNFRSKGYWASCFPEGDGITLHWDASTKRTAQQVIQDIKESFGWNVKWER